MNLVRLVIAAVAVWVPCLVAAAQSTPPLHTLVGRTIDARVVRIANGDTLELVPAGQRERVRVRLEGVDAPELGEDFSRDAQSFLRRLLVDQPIRLSGRDIDRYGRLVARVRIGGRDVSQLLLEAGLACQRFTVDATLAAAEEQARTAGRGFWAASARKPQCVARGSASGAPPPPPSARTAPSPMTTAAARTVRGNVSSKLYHQASCPNFRCRNCTRVFASEADARAAGFRPAGDCVK